MSVEGALVLLLFATLAFALVSRRVDRSPLTLPITFTALGYGLSLLAADSIDVEASMPIARAIAEATLVLILFSDAARIHFDQLSKGYRLPLRMLLIGMPLTVLLGTAVTYAILPEGGWATALLVGAILTPTDAALGQSVVESEDVPEHLSQAIVVESGLNDGLALPIVLVAISLTAVSAADGSTAGGLTGQILLQIAFGPLTGVAVGWGAARLLDVARARDTVSTSFQGVYFLASAFFAFALAELIGGNGFLAAFVGGAAFGHCHRRDVAFIDDFMAGEGRILTIASFVIFGAVLTPLAIDHISWKTLSLAVLSLTVVRMAPVYLSLTGLGVPAREKFFLGWFGPRGLASILFVLIVVEGNDIPGEDEVLACVVLTVLLSIVLHGVTAATLARRIGR